MGLLESPGGEVEKLRAFVSSIYFVHYYYIYFWILVQRFELIAPVFFLVGVRTELNIEPLLAIRQIILQCSVNSFTPNPMPFGFQVARSFVSLAVFRSIRPRAC